VHDGVQALRLAGQREQKREITCVTSYFAIVKGVGD
jgi:hypothetical protein